jgi:tetratricopeptide (TPR) repeat protein
MTKDNILFAVVGLLTGLIVGFIFANTLNERGAVSATPPSGEMRANSNMPPGHPDIGAVGNPQGGMMQPQMLESVDKAKQDPTDFDAQLKAAEAYYQIERFDEAVKYLTAANKLRPDDREVVVHLGNANFDANKYDEAQKWYTAALAKKSDDVNVRTDLGLTYVFREPPDYDKAIVEFNKALEIDPNHIQTLQNLTVAYTKKGDAAKAKATLSKLESIDPQNVSVAKLKTDIETLAATPK